MAANTKEKSAIVTMLLMARELRSFWTARAMKGGGRMEYTTAKANLCGLMDLHTRAPMSKARRRGWELLLMLQKSIT